ncbi:MAG TPA: BatA domain-containing protein [Gemmataceae bacterium]|nr:BatA domain-containing protein [Gemmataceae bacterium]
MEFLNVYLLAGLVLLAVPVLVHLIMRQKPRRLPFPAFQFLRQRSLINRRKMRLQHLLLLLLRMAVLAALIMAVAQPKAPLPRAWAAWLGLARPRPAAVVFVFDSSYSMDYRVGGLSRLDDARQRALELLHDLPPDSRVAVIDTGGGDDGDDDWITAPAQVRSRINGLRPRPVRAPLVGGIERAAELLAKASDDGEPSSRRLYIISDRTTTSWDADAARAVKIPDGVQAAYIDLGVDNPVNLSIDKVEVKPTVVPPGGEVTVAATVRVVGGDFDANLLCQLDGAGSLATRHVSMSAGSRAPAVVEFKLKAPTPARPPASPDGVVMEPHQVVVKFSAADDRPFTDNLPFDNIRYAAFFVRDDAKRPGRRVLAIADVTAPKDAAPVRYWDAALKAYLAYYPAEGFASEVRSSADAAKLSLKDLEPYRVVCLFQTAEPLPSELGKALEDYVDSGGGLAIVPPLKTPDPAKWNNSLLPLLPAKLLRVATAPPGKPIYWEDFPNNHPLTRPFYDWKHKPEGDFFVDDALLPFVTRYWKVEPIADQALVASTYADGSPALVDLRRGEGDKEEKRGRVLLFTTRLDRPSPNDSADPSWNNFYESSFGPVLINEACKFLAGDSSAEDLNFVCGTPIELPLPPSAARGVYRLNSPDPDLSESERSITVDDKDRSLKIGAASAPGLYSVFDPNRNLFTAFSLNVSPGESQLDRLPAQEIERALGPGSVVAAQPGVSLDATLRERTAAMTAPEPPTAPVPLLPLLMVLTLLFLTFEGLLANRFYERPSSAAAGRPEGEQAPS